ncbi:ABC transporter substrate-binding protein [Haloarchaeobius sp. HME9146]|uniref:ABC transporter substrate-binding protein n=1 Tax=Haloarchaeobius sp. HME9146 TaxID=2978732 RepID=UPI0021C18DF5|nr:ABC transporter substrate-binding protein [Haloarchaeobius sp. HME9146]MCT9094467.1 ABC transporter substrate-binding protein [Haloarchaeobius sp. HME9146]
MGGTNNRGTGTSRRTALKTLGAAGVAGLTGLSGCLGGLGGGGGGTDTLTVGYTTSLSGPFAVFGESALDGAKMAVEDLKDELGVDIEIVTGDTKLEPSTGVSRMKKLVTEDGADFTMGAVSSSVALKMGEWASQNEVVYFPTGAHSDALTGSGCGKYVFRPTTSNSMLAATIGEEMANQADNWYLLYSDYSWGQTAQAAVTRILESQGKTVVGKSATPFPNDDYAPYLNEAKSADADGIGMLVAGLDLRKATNQLLAKGMHENHVLAMHQLEDAVYNDKKAASVLDAAGQVWGPGVDNSASNDFATRVAENSETSPYVRHYLGYVAMDQAVRAAVRADSSGAEEMRSALEGHEVTSPAKDIKGGEKMYWREGDHQLIQPTFSMEALPESDMQDDPYKRWFTATKTFAGDDVARSVADTGCSF